MLLELPNWMVGNFTLKQIRIMKLMFFSSAPHGFVLFMREEVENLMLKSKSIYINTYLTLWCSVLNQGTLMLCQNYLLYHCFLPPHYRSLLKYIHHDFKLWLLLCTLWALRPKLILCLCLVYLKFHISLEFIEWNCLLIVSSNPLFFSSKSTK